MVPYLERIRGRNDSHSTLAASVITPHSSYFFKSFSRREMSCFSNDGTTKVGIPVGIVYEKLQND